MSKKILFILPFLVILFNLSLTTSFARTSEGKCETSDECQADVNNAQAMLDKLSKEKDTLSNQIKVLDSQVYLTNVKIIQIEKSIEILSKDIQSLSQKISQLDTYLDRLSSVFLLQIQESYKLQQKNPQLAFFSTTNFDQIVRQYKYIKTLQKINQNSLVDMETTRTNFDLQKQEKTQKQEQLAKLQDDLADQKKSLEKQQASKKSLLQITKNDESKYQKLKKEAEAELSSLLAAKYVGKKDVKKGDLLGLMGNTGYSFGDHLHFGLYNLKESELSSWTYANDIDPSAFLAKNSWPMENYTITQGRGRTQYYYLYSDKFHHGIDMVSSNKMVKAASDGIAYFYRNASSSLGNHVKLFHPDGTMSLYLHLK